MKTCRTCHKTYQDDTLVYCLDDGTRLGDAEATDANATLNLPGPTIHAGAVMPKTPATAANQATITARPEHYQILQAYGATVAEPKARKSSLPWIFAIALVLGVSGVVVAWLIMRGRDDQAQSRSGNPTARTSPRSSPEATAEVVSTPRIHDPKPTFEVLDNMTFNGTRITYYPRASFAECEADCLGNANCSGFTWIRPGAYNPGEAAMCYLMSSVTARVPHACCISGVRN